jgi:hypothetical protein
MYVLCKSYYNTPIGVFRSLDDLTESLIPEAELRKLAGYESALTKVHGRREGLGSGHIVCGSIGYLARGYVGAQLTSGVISPEVTYHTPREPEMLRVLDFSEPNRGFIGTAEPTPCYDVEFHDGSITIRETLPSTYSGEPRPARKTLYERIVL